MKTLIQTIGIHNQDIGMKFDIEKCAMLIIKRKKEKQRKNRTTKLGKHYNTWRERKLHVLRNIVSIYQQSSED